MRAKSIVALAAGFALWSAIVMAAPAANAVQIGVGYGETFTCVSSDVGIDELGQAYFGGTSRDSRGKPVVYTLQDAVAAVLGACLDLKVLQPYTVVVFLARQTENAPQTTVVHFVYNRSRPVPVGSTSLPGIGTASWVYISGDPLQTVASQLVANPIENPIWSQLGQLAGAIEKPFEKVALKASASPERRLVLHVTRSVSLRYARASIVETDSIAVPRRDAKFNLVGANGKDTDAQGRPVVEPVYQEVKGNVTFTNTPRTVITLNAAVGVLVGSVSGDVKMKVDSKVYVAEPLTRGLAMVGVTLHAPYDASAVRPSPRGVLGLFVGGVVSPSAGLAVAASVGWKGVSLLAGGAVFFIQTAPEGHAAGASADGVSPPLVNGTSRSAFIGASYAFK